MFLLLLPYAFVDLFLRIILNLVSRPKHIHLITYSFVLNFTRQFTNSLIEVIGSFAELFSFFILGMISNIVRPFEVDWTLLLVCVIVLYICRYAAVTGVFSTVLKWIEPNKRFLDHGHVCFSNPNHH